MADFPGQGYPSHVPPQHAPRLQQRKRKQKPPASLSKLHRPLVSYKPQIRNTNSSSSHKKKMNKNTNPKTRFYCNDCKKKFRSRILANRNNNAVQHYCSLYSKIITRKVDSHSNKCKGDHGMGPCVVRRTDSDPDSDGEDETKAAYYADRGKKRPASGRKSSGAYAKTKKRKRESDDDVNGHKRQRRNHNDVIQQPIIQSAVPPIVHYPPMSGFNGYYHENGYVQAQHGYSREYGAYPPITPMLSYGNGGYNNHNRASDMPPPPIMEHAQSTGSTPPTAIVVRDNDVNVAVGPPPALEALEPVVVTVAVPVPPVPMAMEIEKNGNDNCMEVFDVSDNVDGMIHTKGDVNDNNNNNNNNNKVDEVIETKGKEEVVNVDVDVDEDEDDDVECINDENTEEEEEDDDLPDLTVPCNSLSPTSNNKLQENQQENGQENEDDDDLILVAP